MNAKYLSLNVESRVATVLLNRHDKGNALSPDVLGELGDLFEHLDSRPDVSVIILTGGEKMFSAGFDLDFLKTVRKGANEAFTALFHRAYRAIMFCSQPVIAAVGGPAMAGGFDLTLMCDIRYASERAKFSQREITLSLTPILDPLWRVIGLGAAKEWALTGKIIDAREAFRLGYVSQVFPEGTVVEKVTAIAREMASYDRTCLMETKRLSIDLLHNSLDGSLRIQEWLFRTYVGSEDNHSRIDSLLEKIRASKKKQSPASTETF